jgi:CIC family chloride channel protein
MRLPENVGRRLYDSVRGSHAGLVAVALIIGVAAGVGAVVFRYLIVWATVVFTGQPDYSVANHAADQRIPELGRWFVVLVPVAGGLIYGPLIERFAREARGHGVPEVMLAVAAEGGRIRPRVAVVKSLASALCIGTGGSVGREGPIVQIGSAVGSALGQWLRVSEQRLRLLVACGAAGGISATFNAPIAGIMFGLELILRDFEAESFGVVVLSSVAADVVGRAAFGSRAFLAVPPFQLVSLWEYALYAGLGLICALVGLVFIRVLYGSEDVFDRVWHGPEWLRPVAGGVLLGLVLLVLPQMYGVGYPVLERALGGTYSVALLWWLLLGKILATSITIAIGGSGGVFAPSLFMGAMLGTAYGHVANAAFPGITAPAGAYGLVGMGAVFAAAARAPMTAAIIIFELTDEYRIILPLLFAISLATGIANLLTEDTIYTLKLRRRGIDVSKKTEANPMRLITVSAAMGAAPTGVPRDLAVRDTVRHFTDQHRNALPVVDRDGRYRGTVTSRRVEEAMRQNAMTTPIGNLAEDIPKIRQQQTLDEALESLVDHELEGLPVVSGEGGNQIVGWLTHRDVLRAYYEWSRRNRTEKLSATNSRPFMRTAGVRHSSVKEQ